MERKNDGINRAKWWQIAGLAAVEINVQNTKCIMRNRNIGVKE